MRMKSEAQVRWNKKHYAIRMWRLVQPLEREVCGHCRVELPVTGRCDCRR